MLMASHLAGVGQASGTGVGLVHALGHSIGTRGKVAHGTALAAVLPEVLALLPRHARPRARARRDRARRRVGRRDPKSTAAAVAIGAIDKLLRDVDQRPTLRRLGLADDAAIDQLVTDTLDDAAIRNSPRLPTAVEARAILEAVPAELEAILAPRRPTASRPAAARPRR